MLASIRAHERTEADEVQLTGIAARIARATEGWPTEGSTRDRKHFLQQIFAEIYFRGATITAFRLAPGLVGEWDGVWRFASELPVSLDPPLYLTPPPIVVEVLEGHKQCSQCREVKAAGSLLQGPSCLQGLRGPTESGVSSPLEVGRDRQLSDPRLRPPCQCTVGGAE